MRLAVFFLFASAAFAQQGLLDTLEFTQVASGLSNPTEIAPARDGSGRLFIAERGGRIWAFDRSFQRGAAPFLDIGGRVGPFGDEQGLLGIAFHPGFATNGRFFVNYTNRAGNTVVSEFRVAANPNLVDAATETVFFTANQTFSNHNGGQIHFGPDGMLYVGMGDGGSGGDPNDAGQSLSTTLGKMLRLDVDQGAPAKAPPDNPFAGMAGARPEIWARGLRNPWRWSFDRATGDMWIADVGQDNWEEINFARAGATRGLNYGWRLMEGRHCFNPGSGCNSGSLTLPIIEYSHAGGSCSVTGGYRYRGAAYPSLAGAYFFADFCSGAFYAAVETGPGAFQRAGPRATAFSISTFGEDEAGEVYFANYWGGEIYRIDGPRQNPSISSGGVVNAASFAAGQSVAPGSIVSVFGIALAETTAQAQGTPLPTTLGGSKFTFAGALEAPAFFVSPGQSNLQIPWELEGQTSSQLTASSGGLVSAQANVSLTPVQPGIFTMDQSGAGQAAALISGTGQLAAPSGQFPNARPAKRGEFVEIFVTGLGPVTNTPPSGAVSPSDPLALTQFGVVARVGGQQVPAQFAGLAPGFIGLYQVNIQIPENLPPGSQISLTLIVNGVESNTVTIAIE